MSDTLRVSNLHFGNAASNYNQPQMGFTSVGIGSTANYGFLQFFGTSNTLCWTANGTVGIGTTNPAYTLDVVGNIRATGSITSASTNIIPTGIIVMWSGSVSNVPAGWVLCNGANGTPNLMDRFIVGAGSTYTPGATGGTTSVTLAVGNLPSHTHTIQPHNHGVSDPGHTHPYGAYNYGVNVAKGPDYGSYTQARDSGAQYTGVSINNSATLTSDPTGSGTSFSIIPVYYAICYIMKS